MYYFSPNFFNTFNDLNIITFKLKSKMSWWLFKGMFKCSWYVNYEVKSMLSLWCHKYLIFKCKFMLIYTFILIFAIFSIFKGNTSFFSYACFIIYFYCFMIWIEMCYFSLLYSQETFNRITAYIKFRVSDNA